MKKKLLTAVFGVGIALGSSSSAMAGLTIEQCRANLIECMESLPNYICGADYRECVSYL